MYEQEMNSKTREIK